jgi:dipeptidyl aminopeptidase/acylaminoacyl peptidase
VLYWLEGRPEEGGRQVVVRWRGGGIEEVTPPTVNVRTRVHEYGGGDYLARDGIVFFVDFADSRIHRIEDGEARPLDGTERGVRYADFDLSPDGSWLVAVEERDRQGREPENRIVALPAVGGRPCVVETGTDLVSSPRFSPDGRRMAFTCWDHPNMPWDGTELHLVPWGESGPAGPSQRVAGGVEESILQPSFSPAGRLTFVSDRSGWWNLYQLRDHRIVPLCPREAEFGRPQWVLGQSTYAFAADDTILCSYGDRGFERLGRLHPMRGALEDLPLPYTSIEGLRVEAGKACFVGAAPARAGAVCLLSLADGRVREVRSSLGAEVDTDFLASPEAIEFANEEGERTHAFLYRPHNPRFRAPAEERAPLLVKSHGGPTSAASPALRLSHQYWTSRGFTVVDVNYGGSTGYGRAYRNRLRGRWGLLDVADCCSAAHYLVSEGIVDPDRLAITGSSAGGYTTLCALTFRDIFAAGASYYGIGDLEALARDTHKFEAHYLDRLVGPYPERRDLYRERSPIHFADGLTCPVIFFQGLEDRVVPPAQAEAMVAALAARGIPHAYVPFPGEQHGFRRAENLRTALDGELFFYAQVFGFDVDVRPDAARIVR